MSTSPKKIEKTVLVAIGEPNASFHLVADVSELEAGLLMEYALRLINARKLNQSKGAK